MVSVCDQSQCTMCNACANICPKNCITRTSNGNQYYMSIDSAVCISCHRCDKVCPNCTNPQLGESFAVYAAWAIDSDVRRDSASGGVASTIYQWALVNKMNIVGAVMDDNLEVHLLLSCDPQYLQKFRNSKYTFCYSDDIYESVAKALRNDEGVVFIGLPCQIAGLKNYMREKKAKTDRLYTVDLICHGTPMPEYLKEHVCAIENKKGFKAEKVYFRDPRYGTGNYLFTIYGKQIISTEDRKFSVKNKQASPAYKKPVISDDLYQIGYHCGWIYRDCCYQCKYAQKNRCGDLTLGDSHGLGKIKPYKGDIENVSFVFVNTKKGERLLASLCKENLLNAVERPLEEPYRYEPQLSHPSVGENSTERRIFVENLANGFEHAAATAFKNKMVANRKKEILHVYEIKKAISRAMPDAMREVLHKIHRY